MAKNDKKGLDFRERYEKIFRRAIMKKDARDELYRIRNILFQDGLPLKIETPKQAKLFNECLAQILFNELPCLNLLTLCKGLLGKMELSKHFLYPLIIFLLTGEVSKNCFKIDVAEIESKEMIKKALQTAENSKNTFIKKFLAGDYRLLFSIWEEFHPIHIKISPWADKKEIQTFIKDNWHKIEDHQKLYGKIFLKEIENARLHIIMDVEKRRGRKWREIIEIARGILGENSGITYTIPNFATIYSKARKRKLI